MPAPTLLDIPAFPSRVTPGSTWEDTIATWWLNTKNAFDSFSSYFQYVKTAAIMWSTDVAATYVSANSFTVAGDVHNEYTPGVRVQAACGTDGWKRGHVFTSTYSSGTGRTTVTLSMEWGETLTSNLQYVIHGNDDTTSTATHGSNHALDSIDPLNLVPTGAIIWWPLNTIPTGYIKAVGANVSRSAYANLYNVYGTTYGSGDGSTTFGTPDVRGCFIRSVDDGRGIDPGRSYGGSQGWTYPSHTHTTDPSYVYSSSDGSHAHTGNTYAVSSGSGGGSLYLGSGGMSVGYLTSDGSHNHTVDVASTTSSSAGNGSEVRPYNIAFYPLIKY